MNHPYERHFVAPPSVDCEPLDEPHHSTKLGWLQTVLVLALLGGFVYVLLAYVIPWLVG